MQKKFILWSMPPNKSMEPAPSSVRWREWRNKKKYNRKHCDHPRFNLDFCIILAVLVFRFFIELVLKYDAMDVKLF